MAVNRCRTLLNVFNKQYLFSSSGSTCVIVNHVWKVRFSSDCGKTPGTGSNTSDQTTGSQNKEEDEHREYEDKIKTKILEASLPFVDNYGWSKDAISAGAESLGYPGVSHGLFSRGGAELIQYFYVTCNQKLVEKLKLAIEQDFDTCNITVGKPTEALKTTVKKPKNPKVVLAYAVETRLRMIEPYLSHWPQALAIMTLPPNVPTSLANLLTLVDDIWYYAGDRSVDFNWYTRRVALAGIYKMTELYMIQDGSHDHEATWMFLNRRLDEANQLHSLFLQSESAAQFAKDIALSTFITARNIIGLNWNR